MRASLCSDLDPGTCVVVEIGMHKALGERERRTMSCRVEAKNREQNTTGGGKSEKGTEGGGGERRGEEKVMEGGGSTPVCARGGCPGLPS